MSKRTAGKTATAAQNRYIAKAYDRINLLVPKGRKEMIQAAAEAEGQSVNAYIQEAVYNRMVSEGKEIIQG